MTCPFLREAHVRYCTAAPRKLIVTSAGPHSTERCSSAAYTGCTVYASQEPHAEHPATCPHLRESLTQYCAASPVTKLVPYSEQAGRCGTPGHRYCPLYLAFAQPSGHGRGPSVEGITIPNELYFSPNHMWLYLGPNNSCYIGIDDFLAHLLGRVDGITFMSAKGVHRPTVVLSFNDMNWPVTFPNEMLITGANQYLRHAPERLAADPYGAGWLYEGSELPSVRAGLLDGEHAAAWIAHELERLNECIHRIAAERGSPGDPVLNDGGGVSANALRELTRDELLGVLHEFFGPHAGWGGYRQ